MVKLIFFSLKNTGCTNQTLGFSIFSLSGIIFNMIEPNSEAETPFDEPLEYWKRRMPNDKHALYRYILNIFVDAQLTCECIIMSMVYLDRVLMALNIDLTPRNLRPLILCSFLLASKVWDDVSMWNVDFCEIYPRYNLRLLNKWESEFLVAIGFDVSVSASMYAEYYFNLRMEEIKINGGLETESHIRPLDPEQSKVLEAVSRKSCENLMAIGSRQRSNTGANNQTFSNRFVLS